MATDREQLYRGAARAYLEAAGADNPDDSADTLGRFGPFRAAVDHVTATTEARPEPARPRAWALPPEPGPDVDRVRDDFGNTWVRSSGIGRGWFCKELGIVKPWIGVLNYAPLFDATAEVEAGHAA